MATFFPLGEGLSRGRMVRRRWSVQEGREKRERERERERRVAGYRKPSARPMPRRLYRFTTERRTSVNRYLLTVDFPWPRRNQPNYPLLSLVYSHGCSLLLRLLVSRCVYVSLFSTPNTLSLFRPSFALLSPLDVLLFRVLSLSLSLSLCPVLPHGSAFTLPWRHPCVARRRRGDSRREV